MQYYFLIFFIFIKICSAQVNNVALQYELESLGEPPYIVLNLDTIPISEIEPLFKREQIFAVNFSNKRNVNISFIELYKKYNDSLIIISENEFDDYLIKGLHLVYIKPSKIRSLTDVKLFDSITFISNKIGEFNSIKVESKIDLIDSLFIKMWIKSGRLPDFIETNRTSLLKVDSIVTRLNSLRKVYGVIETEKGELITGVRFKDYNQSIVNGYFSFPIINNEVLPILIPYKPGYHFSPDIIYTTPGNLFNSKKFSAFPFDIDYGLTDHFVFDPKFKNKVKENDKELLINDVQIKVDEVQGKVGYFNNGSYIDTGIESKKSLQENFTIAAWVKPTSLGFNNSILGKGENFVVKLSYGFLTFTMAGIKDYISEASLIPLNEWTHIALAHSKIDNKLFFYVNGELTEEVKLVSEYVTSDYNILIGTNLWEEFFDGYLADIKIWERELNRNEIVTLLETREHKILNSFFIGGIIVFTLLLVVLIFLLKIYKSKRRTSIFNKPIYHVGKKSIDVSNIHMGDNFESILCFGKLRIINSEGVDITEKFSPLLKKIFIIVFLYSHQGNKKGISTKQLTEFLWPGMSSQKAKNTRSTNINNLRTILNSCTGVNLVFKNKSWFVELGENCFCDYQKVETYLHLFSRKDYSIKELEIELPKFLEILKGGRLFSSSSESWLDSFIEKFSNQIIEQCLEFTEILDIEKHSDLLLLLTEVICLYDDLNEKAHQLKLQALIQQGKLSLAYKAYDNFIKLYYKIYRETYSVSFEEMTSKQNLEKK